MKVHQFTLILNADPSEEKGNELYGIFSDGTISTCAGVTKIHFHREAKSLEEAICSAIGDVRSAGFEIKLVEMEPDALLQPT